MKNNLCPHCDGRGFSWKVGKIVSPFDGQLRATTYAEGPHCEHCKGSGTCGLDSWGWALRFILALVLLAFVVSPLLHLIF